MNIQTVRDQIGELPHMTFEQAKLINELILENEYKNLLELGFRYGVSTCYMAAGLQDHGGGRITAIDLLSAKELTPNIDENLAKLGLCEYAKVYFEPSTYNWRLMKFLESETRPQFDFVYLDGAHNWCTDGFAFFLVDRMLAPGGMIIFDDLDWTYEGHDWDWLKEMPEEERTTAQVRKIVDLLVRDHADYDEITYVNDWAIAKKSIHSKSPENDQVVKKEIIYQKEYYPVHVGIGGFLQKVSKSALRSLHRDDQSRDD